MNREIKFRGLRQSGEWVYGGITSHLHSPKNKTQIVSCRFFERQEDKEHYKFYNVRKESIGQFTGRKDIKGIEIYEGDICIATQTLYKVKSPLTVKIIYNSEFARFEPEQFWKSQNEWKSLSDGFKCDYDFEIMGNIFENPELL